MEQFNIKKIELIKKNNITKLTDVMLKFKLKNLTKPLNIIEPITKLDTKNISLFLLMNSFKLFTLFDILRMIKCYVIGINVMKHLV